MSKEKPSVLYVDDEKYNLLAFKSEFRRDYTVFLASSASEGLAVLAQQEVQVIITDQRMPEITGVAFLEEVVAKYPDPIRIILTGYSDIEAIIQAVNKGKIYSYVTKPWDRHELRMTIDNAADAYQLRKANKLLIEDLKAANQNLEEKVRMRTLEVTEKNEELLALNEEKNYLIGIVAHDLRNPLASAISMASLLKSEMKDLDEDRQECIQLLNQSLRRMEEMITRILDIKAIEAKKLQLNVEKVQLSELSKQIIEQFSAMAAKKNIQIHLEAISVCAFLDRNYAIQIWENLLSNAIKFSPKGKNIYLRLQKSQSKVKVEVRDEGPGIAKEEQPKLFGKFQKLSNSPTDGEGSVGLGLSIVKKYVEAMNGTVWCESEVGKGSSFFLEFDMA